jgi:hypothetical protein
MSFTITGNAGLAGALVVLGGASTSTTTADGSGNYSFSGLSAGVYEVLCQGPGYTFSPNGSQQTIVSTNITGVNFTATAVTPQAVWTKQGPLTSLGTFGTEPSVIYEGNAQILSGNVFKMWYLGGGYVSGGIYYAESTDGINWTPYSSNPVIASAISGRVFKNGSTYYGYYCTDNTFTTIGQYTSSDGIHWTLAHSGVVTTGTAGAWDDHQIYNMQVVYIDGNGTWWAVYGGNRTDNILCTGLVSSPDGVTWTKYASNPVMYNFSSTHVRQIGATFYAWGDITVYGTSGPLPYEFPTNFGKTSSTDLKNWAVPVPSLQVSQTWESLCNGNYQLDSPWLLQVGNQTYMWYGGSPHANDGTLFQMGLAIANAPLATVAQVGVEGNIGPSWSLVQAVSNNTFSPSSQSTPMVFPGNVTKGNLIITWLEFQSGYGPIPGDSQGNLYLPILASPLAAGYGLIQGYFAVAQNTGPNTVTWGAAPYAAGQAAEFSGGLLTGLIWVKTNTGTGTTSSASVYGQQNSLVLGFNQNGTALSSPTSPWLPLSGSASPSNLTGVYNFEAAAGAATPSVTLASSVAWGMIAASFPGNANVLPAYPLTSLSTGFNNSIYALGALYQLGQI